MRRRRAGRSSAIEARIVLGNVGWIIRLPRKWHARNNIGRIIPGTGKMVCLEKWCAPKARCAFFQAHPFSRLGKNYSNVNMNITVAAVAELAELAEVAGESSGSSGEKGRK